MLFFPGNGEPRKWVKYETFEVLSATRPDPVLTSWPWLIIHNIGYLLHAWASAGRMQTPLRKHTQDVENPINLS